MGKKRTTAKAVRSKRIRCDSHDALASSRLSVPINTLERDVIRSAATAKGYDLGDYARVAILTHAVRDVVESAKRKQAIVVVKEPVTRHDVERAGEIVASALIEAPSDARLQRLANELTHLLSVDDS